MSDLFLDFDIVKDERRLTQSAMIPYRAYDFIEFYKLVKQKNVIDAISIDIENHSVDFIIGEAVQQSTPTTKRKEID